MLYLMLGAANHDTLQFTDPQVLDIRRQQGRALSFGGGIHHCLGNRLALIEMEAALAALLEHLLSTSPAATRRIELERSRQPAWRRRAVRLLVR